jgi:hypothetical protein
MEKLQNIYSVENWSELFGKYEQLTSTKLCLSCWGDKVKVFNYFRIKEMAKKETKKETNICSFKPQFEDCQIQIKDVNFTITKENLTAEIVEKYFKNEPSLMALINE